MRQLHARAGAFFFRYRNGLGPGLFLLALLIGLPRYPLGRPDLNLWLDLAGIVVALAGQILRIVTIGFDYIERGGRNRQVYASKLVQGGMFSHCRNPLYVGNICLASGLALIVNSLAFYFLVLPVVLYAYISIVAAEEKFLREKFGKEYEQYCQRVNRWVPRLKGWRASIAEMQFNWRRVLVKEYNTIFVVLLILPAVKIWCDYRISGPTTLPPEPMLMTVFGCWLVAYLAVRMLKKRGYLRA